MPALQILHVIVLRREQFCRGAYRATAYINRVILDLNVRPLT